MLQCLVERDNQELHSGISLNDIVISKGNTGRLIEFEIRVNHQFVSQPRSDGLILATPTGSTAYALSAGGPIIYPNLPVFSMAPICPHTLSNRPIILDENDEVEISALRTHESPANLALDGVITTQLQGDETIIINRAEKKLKMVRIKGFNYFETLNSKLGWVG
jgi:NAD+ kinase